MGVQATEWVHMHSSMCRMCYCAHAVKTSRGLCIIPGTTEAAFLISSLTSARATFGGSVSRGASSAAAVRRLMDEEMSKRIPIFRGRFPATRLAGGPPVSRTRFANQLICAALRVLRLCCAAVDCFEAVLLLPPSRGLQRSARSSAERRPTTARHGLLEGPVRKHPREHMRRQPVSSFLEARWPCRREMASSTSCAGAAA